MITNCVNCGAPLRGLQCDYCGTLYESSCEDDFEKSIAELNGRFQMLKIELSNKLQTEELLSRCFTVFGGRI